MQPFKPDFIVTNCPGCPMFLDRWQYTIAEMEGITYGENGMGIPVLTFEEMAGLVLGYSPGSLDCKCTRFQWNLYWIKWAFLIKKKRNISGKMDGNLDNHKSLIF